MFSKNKDKSADQGLLFNTYLKDIISHSHPLARLADAIDWASFDDGLEECFCHDNGRPSLPTRLMVGLHYLKYTYDLSDEGVLAQWIENPYWQYFTGNTFFEHEFPIDSSSMSNWRKYLKTSGAEKMLEESIKTGLKAGFIKKIELKRVNVDTTVQEKDIRYPTDSRLYHRMLEKLVSQAKNEGINLRQTYERVSVKALHKQSSYARANQFKRARKQCKKLKTYLGRVIRDIDRKKSGSSPDLEELLVLGKRILEQKKNDKNKLYSIHEPHVECISKGKVHKKYEFGCKVSYVTSSKANWVLGAKAIHGNPYDGHTLKTALEQTSMLLGFEPEMAVCDMGYRGHNYEGNSKILLVNRYRKRVPHSVRFWWKRRSAIEPVIGHMKNENGLNRNRLKGPFGDEMNAIFAGIGFNMRKLLKAMSNFLALFHKRIIIVILKEALACFTPPASLVSGRSIFIQLPLTA
jgi:IS5 family transposase